MLKMKYPTRIYYTETDKSLKWVCWQKGESLKIFLIDPGGPQSGMSCYSIDGIHQARSLQEHDNA